MNKLCIRKQEILRIQALVCQCLVLAGEMSFVKPMGMCRCHRKVGVGVYRESMGYTLLCMHIELRMINYLVLMNVRLNVNETVCGLESTRNVYVP